MQAATAGDRDGYAPRAELFAGVLAPFALPTAPADELLRDYRAGFPSACVLFPDALPTLNALRRDGLMLGLITNGSVAMQSAKLNALALTAAFDVMLISDAEGFAEPDPRIFHRAVERLRVEPEQAVFVGDHPEVDVAGARAAGMRTVWRRTAGVSTAVAADTVIDQLDELVGLVGPRRGAETAERSQPR